MMNLNKLKSKKIQLSRKMENFFHFLFRFSFLVSSVVQGMCWMKKELGVRNGRMWTSILMRRRGSFRSKRRNRSVFDRSSTDFLSFLFSRSYLPRYEGPSKPLVFIRIRSCAQICMPFKREIL